MWFFRRTTFHFKRTPFAKGTIEAEGLHKFHQSYIMVQALGSVATVINDLLHSERLDCVNWLINQTHIDVPQHRVYKPAWKAADYDHFHVAL